MSTLTPEGVLSFPHLYVPKAVTQGGEPRYSMTLIFDAAAQASAEYRQLRQDVVAAIDAQWGAGKSRDVAFVRSLRLPFRPATEKKYPGYDTGKVFISPWTKEKPGVVDAGTANSDPKLIHAASDVWAGQLARASVTAFAYDKGANKGVAYMLDHLQITKADMPRMDGRKSALQTFASVVRHDDGGVGAENDDDDEPAF